MRIGYEKCKEKMANALLELLEEKTLQEISIGELCKKCGIARTTYYYHYQNMEETVEDIFSATVEEMIGMESSSQEDCFFSLNFQKNSPSK